MIHNDFGEVFFSQPQGIDKRLGIPVDFCAPENLFEDVPPTSDIWSLACLILNIIGDYPL